MAEKKKVKKYISLSQACRLLEISAATGRNWIRLGKLKAVSVADSTDEDYLEAASSGQSVFLKSQIDSMVSSLRKGELDELKSRRNKSALKGRELYVNYVSRQSPNHQAVSMLVSDFSGTSTAITALLCESFLQLLIDDKRISTDVTENFLKAYLEERLDAAEYQWLLEELIDSTPRKSLSNAATKLPDFRLRFVKYEDTLGLIYLSLMELSKRRQSGRYYTPQNLTDTAIETLHLYPGRVFLDPCCGSGNFLLRLLKRGARVEDLYGCDLDSFSVTLTRVNFVLSGDCTDREILNTHLLRCDTITAKLLPKADVIIGNPPWGSCDDDRIIKRYSRTLVCAAKQRPCFADLFVERSLNLLKEGGIVQFVLPEALLNVASHETVRKFIYENSRVKAVRYLGEVFHAVQCPSVILTLEKTSYKGACGDVIVNIDDKTYVVRRKRRDGDFNFKVTDEEAQVLDKMDDLDHCVKLRGHARFALGIVTGSNKGVITEKRTPGSEEVLRGTDVIPFKISTPQSYVVYREDSFQQVAPLEYYRAPEKLVYRFIAKYPIVAVDRKGRLTLNSCNVLVSEFKNISSTYLAAVLNSSAVRFYFEKKFHTIKILKSLLEEVPVPIPSHDDELIIEELAARLENADPDTYNEICAQIDCKIARIYDLDEKAMRLIQSVKLQNAKN
ncbi:MAG: N-6 DNA methylase [Succinivibrio sp.]